MSPINRAHPYNTGEGGRFKSYPRYHLYRPAGSFRVSGFFSSGYEPDSRAHPHKHRGRWQFQFLPPLPLIPTRWIFGFSGFFFFGL